MVHQHVEKVTIDIEKANQRCDSDGTRLFDGAASDHWYPKKAVWYA